MDPDHGSPRGTGGAYPAELGCTILLITSGWNAKSWRAREAEHRTSVVLSLEFDRFLIATRGPRFALSKGHATEEAHLPMPVHSEGHIMQGKVIVTTLAAVSMLVPSVGSSAQPAPTTIIGCLVQGLPGSATATEGIEAKTAQDYFIRTATVRVPPGTTVAVGTPGTTSTATSSGIPVSDSFYRVSGLSADLLRPHLGQRVELQGHLTDNTPGIESRRATTTQDRDGRATTTVETRIAIAGVLHATTVKMVDASCQ